MPPSPVTDPRSPFNPSNPASPINPSNPASPYYRHRHHGRTEQSSDKQDSANRKRKYHGFMAENMYEQCLRYHHKYTKKPATLLFNPEEVSIYEQCCIKNNYYLNDSPFENHSHNPCACSLFTPEVKQKCEQVQAESGCSCSTVSSGTSSSLLGVLFASISDSILESVKAFF